MKILTCITVAYFVSTVMTIGLTSASSPAPVELPKQLTTSCGPVDVDSKKLHVALVGIFESHFDAKLKDLQNGMKSELQGLDMKFEKLLAAEIKNITGYTYPILEDLKNKMEEQMQVLNAKGSTSNALLLTHNPPRTCADVYFPLSRPVVTLGNAMQVTCDTQTDGGGWLVFQRRTSGEVDFYRNWVNYTLGFGDQDNFWLGLEKLHLLTSQGKYKLRIDMAFGDEKFFAEYDNFVIDGAETFYKLHVSGYNEESTAGDSFTQQNEASFSTVDNDHDDKDDEWERKGWSNKNCAIQYHGAWWYHKCCASNLNGHYGDSSDKGLFWASAKGHTTSATFTEMKIKPVSSD